MQARHTRDRFFPGQFFHMSTNEMQVMRKEMIHFAFIVFFSRPIKIWTCPSTRPTTSTSTSLGLLDQQVIIYFNTFFSLFSPCCYSVCLCIIQVLCAILFVLLFILQSPPIQKVTRQCSTRQSHQTLTFFILLNRFVLSPTLTFLAQPFIIYIYIYYIFFFFFEHFLHV